MTSDLLSLRQHRHLKTMTIRQLAAAAEVGTQTIVRIERGESARPSTFQRLATALGIKPTEIREFMEMVMDA